MVQTRSQWKAHVGKWLDACKKEFGCTHDMLPGWNPQDYWLHHYKLLQSVSHGGAFHLPGCPPVCHEEAGIMGKQLFRYAVDHHLTCLLQQLISFALGSFHNYVYFNEHGFCTCWQRPCEPEQHATKPVALVEMLNQAGALLRKVRHIIVPLRQSRERYFSWWEDVIYNCFSLGSKELIVEVLDAGISPNYCTVVMGGKRITPMDIVFEDGRDTELIQLLRERGGVFGYHSNLNSYLSPSVTVSKLYDIEYSQMEQVQKRKEAELRVWLK